MTYTNNNKRCISRVSFDEVKKTDTGLAGIGPPAGSAPAASLYPEN